jgi:hypothetical protein
MYESGRLSDAIFAFLGAAKITISYNFFIRQAYIPIASYYIWPRWLIDIPSKLDTNRPA